MATKPTILPEWNTDNVNRTPPSVAKKALGWILGERPAGGYFNWLAYYTYEWLLYLKEGALEGDHSIDGDLDITGDLSADGSATVGGDLHVTGDTTHGDKVLNLDFVNGLKTGTWQIDAITFALEVVGGAGTITVTLPLHEGDRAKSCVVARYGNGVNDIQVTAYTIDAAGDQTILDTETTAAPASSWADTTLDLGNTEIAAGVALRLRFSAGGADIAAGSVRLAYDRPPAP
jgi:hypothetical protein